MRPQQTSAGHKLTSVEPQLTRMDHNDGEGEDDIQYERVAVKTTDKMNGQRCRRPRLTTGWQRGTVDDGQVERDKTTGNIRKVKTLAKTDVRSFYSSSSSPSNRSSSTSSSLSL